MSKLREALDLKRAAHLFRLKQAGSSAKPSIRVGFPLLDLNPSIPYGSAVEVTLFLPYPMVEIDIKDWVKKHEQHLLQT